MDVLILCTGNICRSPAAEALLRHRLEGLGVPVTIRSAGLLEGGNPASAHGVDVLRQLGIDMSAHRSQPLTADLIAGADLVLAMAREHVREAVVQTPQAWPRTFTLKELVRRGERIGPRAPDEPLDVWLKRAGTGRTTSELMGSSPDDDVEDPIGQPRPAYKRMVTDLTDLLDRLVSLVWGEEARARSGVAGLGS